MCVSYDATDIAYSCDIAHIGNISYRTSSISSNASYIISSGCHISSHSNASHSSISNISSTSVSSKGTTDFLSS